MYKFFPFKVPIIDGIDHKTFEYRPVYAENKHFRGIFEWVWFI
jgi:polypeptide N-acetylgalactosaminyltransferase